MRHCIASRKVRIINTRNRRRKNIELSLERITNNLAFLSRRR